MLRVLLTFCLLFAISPDDSFSRRKTGNIGNKKMKAVKGPLGPRIPGAKNEDNVATGQPVGNDCVLAGCSRVGPDQPWVQPVNKNSGLDKCMLNNNDEVGVVNCNHHGRRSPIRDAGSRVQSGANLADICCR